MFHFYDRDNKGTLDYSEFRSAVRRDGKMNAKTLHDKDLQLSTFFSPVLQYFGGAAGTGPREGEDMTGVAHGAVLDPHHPRQNQNQNNINDHGGIGKGADSKWIWTSVLN